MIDFLKEVGDTRGVVAISRSYDVEEPFEPTPEEVHQYLVYLQEHNKLANWWIE